MMIVMHLYGHSKDIDYDIYIYIIYVFAMSMQMYNCHHSIILEVRYPLSQNLTYIPTISDIVNCLILFTIFTWCIQSRSLLLCHTSYFYF